MKLLPFTQAHGGGDPTKKKEKKSFPQGDLKQGSWPQSSSSKLHSCAQAGVRCAHMLSAAAQRAVSSVQCTTCSGSCVNSGSCECWSQ
eukprot:17159-Heterococcus_DN1.PRE.2